MTGPDPAVAAARSAVRAALADVPSGSLVMVALSGGADSLALAAATAFVAPRMSLRGGAVVVDHGLQPASGKVARAAADAAARLGLDPVRVVPVDVPNGGAGPEADARSARYAALRRVADDEEAAAVLLGHTRDDQAETVLLGLARGSGARSLSGMPARSGLLRRPLLALTRTQTEQVCRALGLTPWQDPHNDDPRFTRSRLRAAVPLLEDALGAGATAALARSADLLRDDADALDQWADDVWSAVVVASPASGHGSVELDVDGLAALPPAVRRRVLLRAARTAGSRPGALASVHLASLDALVVDWHGQGAAHLPGGIRGLRRCGRLVLVDDKDMGADLEKILVTEGQIRTRLSELATQIDEDYAGRDLLLVGVLKGAVMVMADLARALHTPAEMDWMAVSSYGSGTKSSGVVRILKDLDKDITGRNVLIVEDIVDSGLTLSWLISNLRTRGPESVEVCALLRKPAAAKVQIDVKYVGFDIDPEFVIGYGLDYAEKYRNLPFVGTLAPHVYS